MDIAFTNAPGKGDTDRLLQQVGAALAGQGLAVCGTVQVNTDCPSHGPCDMDVHCLPDGPTIRISQSLGPEARGCRLDPDALEQAVGWVEARLSAGGIDLLVVNKFGKHEADGRGFRSAIGTALAEGIPVLVGLNGLNRAAFDVFTGGIAVEVAPEVDALTAWASAAATRATAAAE